MSNAAITWLEAQFEETYLDYEAMLRVTGGPGYRPMIELVEQDDAASSAWWPEPAFSQDLDETPGWHLASRDAP